MMRGFTVFILLTACTFNALAWPRPKNKDEDKLIKRAQKYLNAYEFSKAEETFRKAIEINPNSFEANFQLGLFYAEVWSDHKSAIPYLEKASTCHGRDTVYELYYQLGISNQALGNYEKAKKNYAVFQHGLKKEKNGEALKQVVVSKQKQCDFASTYAYKAFSGVAVNLGEKVNSKSAEYCAAFFAGDSSILYTRRSENNLGEYSYDYQYHEDVYSAKGWGKNWSDAKPIQESEKYKPFINSEFHDAAVGNSITNDTVFLYKKNKLWYSTLVGDKWSESKLLPKEINFGKHQRHACYASNAKTIIFSSDAKGSKGGFDLYSIHQDGNGNWGTPQNLGDKINTVANEDSPYVTADGSRMYFASQGLPGFGGYDIYYSNRESDGSWSKPVNVGEPFNSPADDIYFRINEKDNGRIFFSSSRVGGFGNMDIYTFEENIEPVFGNCMADDNKKFVEIKGVDSVEMGMNSTFAADLKQDGFIRYFWKTQGEAVEEGPVFKHGFTKRGWNTVELEVYGNNSEVEDYRFCVSKKIFVYTQAEKDSTLAAERKAKEEALAALNSMAKPEHPVKAGMDKLEKVDLGMALENIYFDFDKENVNDEAKTKMEKNLEILRNNGDVYIAIAGHTDSKGSNAYNKRLAERRAKATKAFLIKNGIDASRIVQVASEGEEKPAAANEVNGEDSPEGRAKNRRVEFTVYKRKSA
jgi:outer membrane protein OmpA-like peptidoglycan-associated protein/tetratricopeptide (TPR) repeat protein